MLTKREYYLIKKSVIPILTTLILVLGAYLYPKFQVAYPILSIFILICFTLIFTKYNSYEVLKNKLFLLTDENIKNAVANNKIIETEEFGEKLVKILSEYTINFGVNSVIFKAVDSNYIFSNRNEITNNIPANNYKKFESITCAGLQVLQNKSHEYNFKYKSILLVPILFEEKYLGYFALCSLNIIFGDLDIWLYSDLENFLIDDAFYSLKDKRIKNKIICLERKIDEITNKVCSGEINQVNVFLKNISKIITRELASLGTYFCLEAGNLIYFPNELKLNPIFCIKLNKIFKNNFNPQKIDKNDPNFSDILPFPFLIALPIVFKGKYLGNFGVFLRDKNKVKESSAILSYIEEYILDNYITILSKWII